jgi:hypothetical protein
METGASSGSTNPSLVNTRREFLGSLNTEARKQPRAMTQPMLRTAKKKGRTATAEAVAIRDNITLRPSVGSDPLILSRAES